MTTSKVDICAVLQSCLALTMNGPNIRGKTVIMYSQFVRLSPVLLIHGIGHAHIAN